MKQQENQMTSRIDSFDDEVSIYKILFQDRTTTLLKNIIEQISNDRFDGNPYKYPSILLVGNCSKHLIAQSLANTLCFSYEEIQSDLLSMGGQYNNLYENVDKDTLYHFSNADKLTNYPISNICRFLNQGFIMCRNPINRDTEMVHMTNKMFVFSANNAENLNADLMKLTDYHCFLNDYNNKELSLILELRLRWCNIGFDTAIIPLIVSNCKGSISIGIHLLKVCYAICRSSYKNIIDITDFEKALNLFVRQTNEREIRIDV